MGVLPSALLEATITMASTPEKMKLIYSVRVVMPAIMDSSLSEALSTETTTTFSVETAARKITDARELPLPVRATEFSSSALVIARCMFVSLVGVSFLVIWDGFV